MGTPTITSTENETQPTITTDQPKQRNTKKIVLAIFLIGFIGFVIADSLTTQYIKSGIDIFLKWIENNPIPGVFAFMGVYFIATVLFIPGSILTLGSGFIFANVFGLGYGVILATVAVFIGASAGALVAFLLGRYLLRDWVKTLTTKYPLFEAVDTALEDKGLRIMCLLRLSPIIPFNALNYIAGITAISLTAYTWAMIAILPGTILYIFLGATAGSLTDSGSSGDNGTVKIITIVVGVVFGVLGVGAVSYYAKKELNNVIQKAEEENNEDAVTSSAHHVDIEAGNATESSTKNNVNNSILNDNEVMNNLKRPLFSSNVKSYDSQI